MVSGLFSRPKTLDKTADSCYSFVSDSVQYASEKKRTITTKTPPKAAREDEMKNYLMLVALAVLAVACGIEENDGDFNNEIADTDSDTGEPDNVTVEGTLEACQDGRDNDADGYTDCDDQDCEIYAVCIEPEDAETDTGDEDTGEPEDEDTGDAETDTGEPEDEDTGDAE
ncbi:hypothetical protein JW899_00105, partial [Candidatus Uhrbacteria bacterium]|nr:hypothetical protein [Candidatus Uhrbacteria bacterium]